MINFVFTSFKNAHSDIFALKGIYIKKYKGLVMFLQTPCNSFTGPL